MSFKAENNKNSNQNKKKPTKGAKRNSTLTHKAQKSTAEERNQDEVKEEKFDKPAMTKPNQNTAQKPLQPGIDQD